MASSPDVTALLVQWHDGSEAARDALMPIVYEELRRIAHAQIGRLRPHETLNATAVVHEAYLRLVRPEPVDWQGRTHFFAVAARAMRFVLIDYARKQRAGRRGGGAFRTSLDSNALAVEDAAADLLALDEALDKLASFNEALSRVVEYRFFGGMNNDEIAALEGVSRRTVIRQWQRARLWLLRELDASAEA